jgi:hypothetical protein
VWTVKLTRVVMISVFLATLGCGGPEGDSPLLSSVVPSDSGGTAPAAGDTTPAVSPSTGPSSSSPTPTTPTPSATPSPTPPPAVDAFGVAMLNPTKPQGETWSLAADPRSDGRFDPQLTITPNSDGSWKIESGQVRMGVETSSGYSLTSSSTQDRMTLASRGYMQSPSDWRNVEMTGFVKVNAGASASDLTWYARGGHHNDSVPCEGSAYKGSLRYDGSVRVQKESWHVSYDQAPWAAAISPIAGRWIGFKVVIRNTTVNGAPAVHMEAWLNEDADKVTWQKVYSFDDTGSWGGDSSYCGGDDDSMLLSWGGPIATFRWDDCPDVDFKWFSVREIE